MKGIIRREAKLPFEGHKMVKVLKEVKALREKG